MDLPDEVREAIDQAHKKMLADPLHTLLPKDRLLIYGTFLNLDANTDGTIISNFWPSLAIVTARKILPVWQSEMPEDNLAQRILEVSEGLFQKNLAIIETQYERGSFQRAVGNSEQFVESDRARAALKAIYSTLEVVFDYVPFEKLSKKHIKKGLPDELIADVWGDTAGLSVLAYSGFAYKVDGFSEGTYLFSRGKVEIISQNKTPFLQTNPTSFLKKFFLKGKRLEPENFQKLGLGLNAGFDPEIRKEFWEWWLLEAIPQAWDLAHQTQTQ